MKKLPETLKLIGTGIPGLTSTCLERIDKKAIYKRLDGYFEVFLIKIKPEVTFPNGKIVPEREAYPGNEDFGNTAWCCRDRERAYEIYHKL